MSLRSKSFKYSLFATRLLLLCLCIYATTPFSVNPNQLISPHPYEKYKFVYFTNISLYFTIFSSIVGIWHRFTKSETTKYFNFTLSTCNTFNIVTVLVFWSLYFTKKELIINRNHLKKGNETYLLTELSLHLFPFILSTLEQIDFKLYSTKFQYYFFAVFSLIYLIAIHIFKFLIGVFLYPFLNKMTLIFRILFILGIYGSYNMVYFFSVKLNNYFHSKFNTAVK